MNDLVEVSEQVADADNEQQEKASLGQQYLSFTLGDETFAVEILSVQEIRTWEVPTLLPRSPEYMKGVINLRGTIVPVIDLRIKFNICKPIYDDTTVVIVLRINEDDKVRIMGIVVDAMSDVLFIDKDKIRNSPEFGGKVDAEYIEGLTTIEGNIVSLLTTKALLNINEISHI
jgi:purine-binding chemotaxis protein CheW